MKHLKILCACLNIASLTLFAADKKREVERKVEVKEREEKHKKATSTDPVFYTLIETLTGPSKSIIDTDVSSLVFSPDGHILVSAFADATIKLWNIATKKLDVTLTSSSEPYPETIRWINSIAFSPDGQTLASGTTTLIRLWDIKTKKELTTLTEGHPAYISSVTFSPDGHILAAGTDNTIKLWDVATKTLLTTLEGHTKSIETIAFSPDGKVLASGSYDGTINLWNVKTKELLATFQGHVRAAASMAFSPNGKILASGSPDKTIKLWDITTRELLTTLQGKPHQDNTKHGWPQLVFSPNGQILVSGFPGGSINLWNVTTKKLLQTLDGHTTSINTLAFSPDGKILASGSQDGTIKLWQQVSTETILANVLAKIDHKLLQKQIRELIRSGATESSNKEIRAFAEENRALFEQIQKEEQPQKIIAETPRCTICLDTFDPGQEVVITECSHPFHRECMEGWLNTFPAYPSQKATQDCPICRRVIRTLGEYNQQTGLRSVNPGPTNFRNVVVAAPAAERELELTKKEQQIVHSTLLKLLNTEHRSAEQETTLNTLKEQLPKLYQQAYAEYTHKASPEKLKDIIPKNGE